MVLKDVPTTIHNFGVVLTRRFKKNWSIFGKAMHWQIDGAYFGGVNVLGLVGSRTTEIMVAVVNDRRYAWRNFQFPYLEPGKLESHEFRLSRFTYVTDKSESMSMCSSRVYSAATVTRLTTANKPNTYILASISPIGDSTRLAALSANITWPF